MEKESVPVKDVVIVVIGCLLIISLLWVFGDGKRTTAKEGASIGCFHQYASETGNFCVLCGAEFVPEVIPVDKVMFISKQNSKVRSDYYTNDNVIETLPLNTPVTVVASLINSVGSEWYMTDEGNYIFASNLASDPYVCDVHTFTSEGKDVCTVCGAVYEPEISHVNKTMYVTKDQTIVRSEMYNADNVVQKLSCNDKVNVVGMVDNSLGSTWYILDNGTYIFAGNLSDTVVECTNHTYEGAVCTVCGHVFEPVVVKLDKTMTVTKKNTAVRSDCYSADNIVEKLNKGVSVHIVGACINSLGSDWYITGDGYYIFADNLTE